MFIRGGDRQSSLKAPQRKQLKQFNLIQLSVPPLDFITSLFATFNCQACNYSL